MYRYLRKLKTLKVGTFTTRLIQLNNYLPYFTPDCVGQMVTAPSDDEVKEILSHILLNSWGKKMTEQGYNYLDRSIQEMSGFFETRVENLDTLAPPPAVRRKAVSLMILTNIAQTMRNPQEKRNSISIMESAVILRTNVLHSRP